MASDAKTVNEPVFAKVAHGGNHPG